MLKRTTLSSTELNDFQWPPTQLVLDRFEADLARAEARANGAAGMDADRLNPTNGPGARRRIEDLNAALDLATAGLPVMPAIIEQRDDGTYAKRPAVRGWQQGAATDHGQIRGWWRQWPDAVPGIELSRAGLVVIDADRHGGPDGVTVLEQLAVAHGGLPTGPVTETPTGGRHYIYRQPIGQPLGNRRGALPLGIDVRGAGGWIVAPGAIRPDGRRWAAMAGTPSLTGAYASATIPVIPDWLAAIIRATPHRSQPEGLQRGANGAGHYAPSSSDREAVYARQALRSIADELSRTPVGGRNEALNKAAFRMGSMIERGWIDQTDVVDQLSEAAIASGLDVDEVQATLASSLRAGMQNPADDLEERPHTARQGQTQRPCQESQQGPNGVHRVALHDSSEGAEPASSSAASREHSSPPGAESERPDADNVGGSDPGVNGQDAPDLPYTEDNGGIIWHRPIRGGSLPIRVTNFRARIVADVMRDDGVEVTRYYEIAARLGVRSYRFAVPAGQYRTMTWVGEHMGAAAIVEPGQGMEARARHAIQVLSGEIPRRHIYSHTGWRQLDGSHYYLHAGGALGGEGSHTDIDVDLPDQLAGYRLIEPTSDAQRVSAVQASLAVRHLAPLRVIAPLLGAVYRAPIGGSDITVALWGRTGHGKSELAALAQQHYGAGMDARHLPLAWSSTGNTLEAVASAAKDAVLVVDEFVPGESHSDRARMQGAAERLIRAAGNASGRGRMRPDGTLRRARPPRCQPISTGEEVPAGQSLRARMLTAEVGAEDVRWDKLALCQQAAASGTYAIAMASYIMWLAPQLEQVRDAYEAERQRLRATAKEGQHRRTADAIAQIAAAWTIWLRHTVEIGAVGADEASRIRGEVWDALLDLAAGQEELQRATDPVERYRDLIVAALSAGRVHLCAAMTGGAPGPSPEQWGWQRDGLAWRPRGDCIGWVADDGSIFLEPTASYALASRLGSVGVSAETLGARMHDRGLIIVTREGRRRHLRHRIQRVVQGVRRRVLHVRTSQWLYPSDAGASGASGPEGENA
jgi:hypothetical protein